MPPRQPTWFTWVGRNVATTPRQTISSLFPLLSLCALVSFWSSSCPTLQHPAHSGIQNPIYTGHTLVSSSTIFCRFLLERKRQKETCPEIKRPWQSLHRTTRNVAPAKRRDIISLTATWGDIKRTRGPSTPPAEISGPAICTRLFLSPLLSPEGILRRSPSDLWEGTRFDFQNRRG
jgi:hypothetical protein